MGSLFDDMVVQTAIAPLILSSAMAGLLRLAGGSARGRRIAAVGMGVALLAAFIHILGLPAFPPASSLGRVFWSASVGLVLALAIDIAGIAGRRRTVMIGLWFAASLAWVAAPALTTEPSVLITCVVLAGTAWGAISRGESRSEGAVAPGLVLVSAALGVGGVAFVGSSASIAQIAFATAAAAGGFLLWNWPVNRDSWGASGQIMLGFTVLLATALAFFSSSHAEALLALIPALAAENVRDRLRLPPDGLGRIAGTVMLGTLTLLPTIAAVGISVLSSGNSSSGY